MSNRLKRGAVAHKVNDIFTEMGNMPHAKDIHMLLETFYLKHAPILIREEPGFLF